MVRRSVVVFALVLAALPAAKAAAGGGGCLPPDEVTAGRGFEGPSVPMEDCAFTPAILYVDQGTEVTWINMDGVPHTVTGAHLSWGSTDNIPSHPREADGTPSDESSEGIVTHRFDEPGVYPYYCILHPGMAGAVVVGDVEETRSAAEPVEVSVISLAAEQDPPPPRGGAGEATATTDGGGSSVPVLPLALAFVVGAALAVLLRRAGTKSRPSGHSG